jgi:hypothetical protein
VTGRTLRLVFAALVTIATVTATVLGLAMSAQGSAWVVAILGGWAILGAVIVVLRPANAVGWLFVAVGLLWTTGLAASEAAERLDSGPALTFCSWFGEWFWLAGFGLIVVSLYLIPTGRVPSPAWRPVVVLYSVAVAVLVTIAALEEEVQATDEAPVVRNPIGIQGLRDIESFFGAGMLAVNLLGAVGAAASLVVRYRHGSAVERQQLKLVALAAPVAVTSAFLAGATEGTVLSELFWSIGLGVIPAAVAVAILRYRLFDVDRLITRTLVYGLLTVLLGVAYAGLVLLGQAAFSSFAGGSNLAIAASTLVVAALFLPLRSRVQRFVDRRFYRRRYDARRTLDAFGTRLRDQVELDSLRADLESVVRETMQPAYVSLWLREGTPQ